MDRNPKRRGQWLVADGSRRPAPRARSGPRARGMDASVDASHVITPAAPRAPKRTTPTRRRRPKPAAATAALPSPDSSPPYGARRASRRRALARLAAARSCSEGGRKSAGRNTRPPREGEVSARFRRLRTSSLSRRRGSRGGGAKGPPAAAPPRHRRASPRASPASRCLEAPRPQRRRRGQCLKMGRTTATCGRIASTPLPTGPAASGRASISAPGARSR